MGEHEQEDTVIDVTMPKRDYDVMREMIAERQAMSGLKKWLTTRVFWLAGGILSIFGLVEVFKRLAW